MLNKAMIIGNLTRDPELRYTPNGQAVASFGVATNRRWNDAAGERHEEAEFHEIVAWGKLAEICNQILSKGRKVYIEGRIHSRSWEAPDGSKRTRVEIIASDMRALDRMPAKEGAAEVASEPAVEKEPAEESKKGKAKKSAKAGSASEGKEKKEEVHGEDEISLDDIPF